MKVELTKAQCRSLIDFIEANLLDAIRNDTDIDDLEWVYDILNAKETIERAVKEYEGY